jgi:hypothetical protein
MSKKYSECPKVADTIAASFKLLEIDGTRMLDFTQFAE